MKNKYELLAPVGNFRNLKAALDAGADAVYFGIRGFNMRASAKNFTIRNLPKIKQICDERRVKKYLTLNTVIYEEEIPNIEKIIKKAKDYVDAIICVDMAVINLCKKYKVPFHISTQASVSNSLSVKFYKSLGAQRVVLARELSLKKIEKLSKLIDIECFVHGAMCVAVSGRCFMSQYTYGASANRGQCAQLCRRSWRIKDDSGNELKLENSRVMSAKDLCTLPFIGDMKKAGIKSFKIEGRNRNPEYVYTVVSQYRKALDKKLSHEEIVKGLNELRKVYNRGFSSGFYIKMPTADDFSFSENGEQSERKEFIGKVYKYWPKSKACAMKLNAGKVRVGDEVYLTSDSIGIKRAKVKSIELERKAVNSAKKGDDIGIDFGVKVNKGVEVYVISKV